MIKNFFVGILLVTVLGIVSSAASAQSILRADGTTHVRKSGADTYLSEGRNVSYRFAESGEVLLSQGGSDPVKVATYKREEDGRISYYDGFTADYMGSYYPSSMRFLDAKENTRALLSGNELLDEGGSLLYTLDGEVPMLVLAFFVYFTY